jgi:hypothetical protein
MQTITAENNTAMYGIELSNGYSNLAKGIDNIQLKPV